MENAPRIKLNAFTIDAPDHAALADFYVRLMDWTVGYSGDEYVVIAPKNTARGAYVTLTFQKNEDYVPPTWPEEKGAQQQMAHLDFCVDDMPKAVKLAEELGARRAGTQFTDEWTVMLDPAGHPFCLVAMKFLLDSPDCALL